MRRDGVAAGSRISGIDAGSGVFSSYQATSAGPRIGHCVLGIEIAGRDIGSNRFAHHHFSGLHGAGCGRRQGLNASPAVDDTGSQSHTLKGRTLQVRKGRARQRCIVVMSPDVIRFK